MNELWLSPTEIEDLMRRVGNQQAFGILRGVAVAISLTFSEAEAKDLIDQINNQEIISQYGHKLEYNKVIRNRA